MVARKVSLAILLIGLALLLAACGAGSSITPVEQINVGEAVRQMALAPDGATVVTLSGETAVSAWDVASGEKKYSLPAAASFVTAIAVSPDGKTLAVGEKSGTLTLWELASGKELRTLSGHTQAVSSLAFTQDAALLAAGGSDGSIRLWQPTSGAEQSLSPMQFPASIASLAFSPARRPDGGFDVVRWQGDADGCHHRRGQGADRIRKRHPVDHPHGALGVEDRLFTRWEAACHCWRGQQAAPVERPGGRRRADLHRTNRFRQQHRFLDGRKAAGSRQR